MLRAGLGFGTALLVAAAPAESALDQAIACRLPLESMIAAVDAVPESLRPVKEYAEGAVYTIKSPARAFGLDATTVRAEIWRRSACGPDAHSDSECLHLIDNTLISTFDRTYAAAKTAVETTTGQPCVEHWSERERFEKTKCLFKTSAGEGVLYAPNAKGAASITCAYTTRADDAGG